GPRSWPGTPRTATGTCGPSTGTPRSPGSSSASSSRAPTPAPGPAKHPSRSANACTATPCDCSNEPAASPPDPDPGREHIDGVGLLHRPRVPAEAGLDDGVRA